MNAKLFINNFGINPKTGEEIFETREADDLETRRFIYHHMMNKLYEAEKKEPDFKKIVAEYSSIDEDLSEKIDEERNLRLIETDDFADEYGINLEPPCSNGECDDQIMDRFIDIDRNEIIYRCPICGKEVLEKEVRECTCSYSGKCQRLQ